MGIEEIAIIGTVVSVAAAAAGSYISYEGQQTQAQNATRIAAYNAAVQQQQSQLQSRLAVRQAQINNQYLQTQYNQTAAYAQQANQVRAQAQSDVQRNQERERQMLSRQRAAYAASGVLPDTGSPLNVLSDTAGLFELQNQDTQYAAESKAEALIRQGQLSQAGILTDESVQALNEAAGYASADIGTQQANLTRLEGAAQAQGYQTAAYGSLLSGVGQVASGIGGGINQYQNYQFNQQRSGIAAIG